MCGFKPLGNVTFDWTVESQELESFCRKGYIPPIYDAYAASQQVEPLADDLNGSSSGLVRYV